MCVVVVRLAVVVRSCDCSVEELIAAGLLPNACIRSLYDADSLLEWIPPWMYCRDMLGEDFQDRMKYRLANAIEYPLMIAIHAFT